MQSLKIALITAVISTAGPSNDVVSPTYGKSSFIDASQLPDDLDMPELEDITYSDNEDVVGTEANFNNLESSIPVSPIPTTRIHKDHPNNDKDAAFDGKEHDFDAKKLDSEVILFPSSSAQSKEQDNKTKKEAKGKSLVESVT
nr:hypothetical protein [Tanacetum cinerariifolium]